MYDVLTLIKINSEKDENGIAQKAETKREVFCLADSVTANEFFSANQNGIAAEWRFTIFAADYEKEKKVEFRGERLQVYRTFQSSPDSIELYAEARAGA